MTLPLSQSITALLGFLLLTGCGDATGSSPTSCEPETASVAATVTVGTSVVFDWTPACPVAMVLIEEEASDMWLIAAPESEWATPAGNRIAPPITYGQPPSGITQTAPPEALVPGRTYELILWRILPSGSTAQCQARMGAACLLTVKTFTR